MSCGCNNLPDCNCLPCQEAREYDLNNCTDRGGVLPQPFPITCTPPTVDISPDSAVLSYIDGEPVWIVDSQ